jgi:hypothetical protein
VGAAPEGGRTVTRLRARIAAIREHLRAASGWRLALYVALVVLLVPGGILSGVWLMNEAQKRRAVRQALRKWAEMMNLDPDFIDAIGKVEGPNWNLGARSTDPRDEARGGSFGPTQISEKTARAHGYTGPMEALQRDPEVAAEWTARIMRAGVDANPAGMNTLADYVAWWNAGKVNADRNDDDDLEEMRPGHPTRETYLPAAHAALDYVRSNPA